MSRQSNSMRAKTAVKYRQSTSPKSRTPLDLKTGAFPDFLDQTFQPYTWYRSLQGHPRRASEQYVPSGKVVRTIPHRSESLDEKQLPSNGTRVFNFVHNMNSTLRPEDYAENTLQLKGSMSPLPTPRTGLSDPFANYAVKLDVTEGWFTDDVNVAEHPTFRIFKEAWLPSGMSDPATLHQILSNVALSISIVRGQGVISDNPAALAHNSRAVRTVHNRLSDPIEGISDSTMISVLSLIYYNAAKQDFETWAIHLEGLQNIVQLRGGIDALSSNSQLRLLILWVEVAGACRQDIPPRFPLPSHLLPALSSTAQSKYPSLQIPTLAIWKSMFPARAAIPDLFDDVSTVIIHSRSPDAKKDLAHFNLMWITPLIHRLLSFSGPSPDVEGNKHDPLGIMQEASRLGIILFLAEMRRKCGDIGIPTSAQTRKLRTVLSKPGWVRWALFEPLILWVLFFGALNSESDDCVWFCNSLCLAARNLGIREWKGVVGAVAGFLWITDVFEGKIEALGRKFDFDRALDAGLGL